MTDTQTTIDIQACFDWIEENTTAKGLIPVVPMTSQALAQAKSIPHFYAAQIIEKFLKEKA
jgi:hypothetical protein